MLNDILALVGFVALWYALMRFILPALGVPTCMSGACQPREKQTGRDALRSKIEKSETSVKE